LNVLSLFDGMSCGQIALNRVGIEINNYFASEIDKNAIKITQKNYPETIQLGDVTKIKVDKLPKIDLLIGGSPCQGFSFAGKQLNFEDERSKLFFEYVRILKELQKINPEIKFLLENVKMKKLYQNIISEFLKVEPIEINSNLVSAQNRKRLYWTNIENVQQPEDKNIKLKDILWVDKIGDLTDEYIQKKQNQKRWGNHFGTIETEKSNTLLAIGKFDTILLTDLKRYLTPLECERLQTLPHFYTDCVSEGQRYRAIGNGWTVDVIAHIFKNLK